MTPDNKNTEQLLLEIDQLKNKINELEKSQQLSNTIEHETHLDNESEENYRTIFEGTYDGIVHADKNTIVINVNPAFTTITGIPKDQVIGKSGADLAKKLVHAKHLPSILNLIKTAITRKPFKPYEFDFNNKTLEVSSRRLMNGQFVGIIRDITQHRLAESELKASEERLKIIFDNAPYGIFLGGMDGTVLDGNRASEEILGYKVKDVVGSNIYKVKFTDRSNFPKIAKALAKSALGRKTGPEVYVANRKDGSKVFVEISTFPVKIKNKSIVLGVGQDITKRVEAEKSLVESEEKFRSLFEQSTDSILIIENGRFVDCNPATVKMLGFKSKEDFLQTHPSQLSPEYQPDGNRSYDKAEKMMQIAYEKGSHRFEWTHKRKNGDEFPVEVLLTSVAKGKEKFLHVIWRDITDRKQAEEALVQSEQQYRNFFEKDISGVFLSTPEGKIIDFNPAFAKMFGYSPNEIREMNTTKLYPEPGKRRAFIKHLSKEKTLINLELDLVKKDGQIIHCIENVVGEFDSDGKLIKFQGYLIDITERKLAEEQLKNSEETLKIIFDAAPYGIFLKNKKGELIDGNKEAENIIGQKKEELIGKNISDLNFKLETDKVKLGKTLAKAIMGLSTGPDEFLLNLKDGRQKLVESTSFPIKIKNKSLVLGFAHDITDRRQAERALQEEVHRNELVLETMMDGYILADSEGNILDVNTTYCKMVKYSRKELLAMNVYELEVHLSAKEIDERIQVMMRDGRDQFESKHKCKDGSIIDFEVSIVIILQGELRLVAAFLRDISERKKAAQILKDSENLLKQSQKISLLGSFKLDLITGKWESSEILLDIFGIESNVQLDLKKWLSIIHPDDKEMMKNYFTVNTLTNHEPFNKEHRIIRYSDKEQRWVHCLGELTLNDNNVPIRIIGTVQDITNRKIIDNALQESELKYRSLIENSNDAIYLFYNDRFEVINNKFSEILGYTLEDINSTGFQHIDLVSPKSKQTFIDRQNQFEKGELSGNKYEILLVAKNGTEIEAEVSDVVIDYKDSKAYQCIIRDISSRKKQQELLINAILKVQEDEKYRFGKELHDGLGQMLTSASLYLESLRKYKDALPGNKRNDLEKARQLNKQAITDTRRISHGLMITGIEEFGLAHLIKEICYHSNMPELRFSFTHGTINEEKINIETKIHLYRIVQELSTNILKHAKANEANINLRIDNDNYLMLTVSDNGNGYNPQNVMRGAGLKNIEQRITILGGEQEVVSKISKGTTVKIRIPL